jgi:RNA methyltransferase, TrmH family
MLSKKVLKDIQSLGLKKHRLATGLFVAEGPKIASELLGLVPGKIRQVFATAEWCASANPLPSKVTLFEVTPEELARISQLQTPNGVLLVSEQWQDPLPEQQDGLVLYLDTIQDPGNFGTIIRTADWFGVQHIVCSEGCAERFNPKVVQATMGSIARVRLSYDKDDQWIGAQRSLIAASLDGLPPGALQLPAGAVLMIGNEGKGLRPELLARASQRVTIPKKGGAESLNAAVATGILLAQFSS